MNEIPKFFIDDEIACRCGKCSCKEADPQTLQRAYIARMIAGCPFPIRSWCRCREHNKLSDGAINSAHLRGTALDIGFTDAEHAYKIMNALMIAGFPRVGINWERLFIHADDDKILPQNVLFKY